MKQIFLFILTVAWTFSVHAQDLIPVPNGDFESWVNHGTYNDPEFWDTPNQETSSVPFVGTTVVEKSSDHQTGSFSAKLETKSIPLIGAVPGVVTLGNLGIDLTTLSYTLTGGVPISDKPAYLRGFYKFSPKGGDSCVIGIGLLHWSGNLRDSVGYGVFSTKTITADWTPFAAVIEYDTNLIPDTMNIVAISSASETATAGTILFVDGLWLDYAVGSGEPAPEDGIRVYVDRSTRRVLVFAEFPGSVTATLYNLAGQQIHAVSSSTGSPQRLVLPYPAVQQGIYLLSVRHQQHLYTRKIFLGN